MKQTMSQNNNASTRRNFLLLFVFMAMLIDGASISYAQEGQPWAWGYNGLGQLGDGSLANSVKPVHATGLASILQIAGGDYYSLALKPNGTVLSWGDNLDGQLGDGTTTNRMTFVLVKGLSGVVQVAGGGYHCLAVKSSGAVWAWGANGSGQLGDGTRTQRHTPVQVSGLTGVVQVACGSSHSLALRSDGAVWAWGNNGEGALGDGTNADRYAPVQVSSLTGVVQVAGYYHSLALKSDGTVWAWGNNLRGGLGDGTTTNRKTPVAVSGLASIVQVACGSYYSIALKSDGTVWGWGDNGIGQLGDGTRTERHAPVQVSGLTGVVQVVAGGGHSLALKTDGTLWAWGYNLHGQLGDGTHIDRDKPVQISSLTGQTYISAGDEHSLSVQSLVLPTKVTTSNLTLGYGKPVTLSATIKDAFGRTLINYSLAFSLDGALLGSAKSDASGRATLLAPNPLALSVGSHAITVSFAGDRLYYHASGAATLTVNEAETSIIVGAYSGSPGNNKYLAASLKRKTDNARLSGQTLTFKIDDNSIGTATTGGNGVAFLWYKFGESVGVGSHTLTAEFAGDSNHSSSLGTGTLTIKQSAIYLGISSVSGKVGAIVALKARLLRKTDAAPLDGKTVRFQLDGVDVGNAVSAAGIATLSYTIPSDLSKGAHKIALVFDGDAFYLSSVCNNGATLTVK